MRFKLKKMNRYFLGLVAGLMIMMSCKKEEPLLFDKNTNGLSFDYKTAELKHELNFAKYVVTGEVLMNDTINVKLMGYPFDEAKRIVLKTKASTQYPDKVARIILPDVIELPAGAMTLRIPIQVEKPATMQETYAVVVYIDADDANASLGAGIDELKEFTILVKNSFSQPTEWGQFSMYYGAYSVEKFLYMVEVNETDNLCTYEPYWGIHFEYLEKATTQVRAYNASHPTAPKSFSFPFVKDLNYAKPAYWGAKQDTYLGNYSSAKFVGIARIADVNTGNEVQVLTAADAQLKLLNNQILNGSAALCDEYYRFANSYNLLTELVASFPVFTDVAYNYEQPVCWQENVNINGSVLAEPTMVKKYYGTYSVEKYRFMCETMREWPATIGDWPVYNKTGVNLWAMFLVYPKFGKDDGDITQETYSADAMKLCNQKFRDALAAYNAAHPSAPHTFTFPNVL